MGLTPLGMVHTVIGLFALVCAFVAMFRYFEIPHGSLLGRVYFWTTLVTAATGLFIFQHGGFGPPHVLSILTLITLGVVWLAAAGKFGGKSRYVLVAAYTTTIFFHLIPGFTETLTRLPAGNPIAKSQEDPIVVTIAGINFVIYLIVLGLQLKRMRAAK